MVAKVDWALSPARYGLKVSHGSSAPGIHSGITPGMKMILRVADARAVCSIGRDRSPGNDAATNTSPSMTRAAARPCRPVRELSNGSPFTALGARRQWSTLRHHEGTLNIRWDRDQDTPYQWSCQYAYVQFNR